MMGEVMRVLRVATVDDTDGVAALMRASVLALLPDYYDPVQTVSAAVYMSRKLTRR